MQTPASWAWHWGRPRPIAPGEPTHDLRRLYSDHFKFWLTSLQFVHASLLATAFIGAMNGRARPVVFAALTAAASALALGLLAAAQRVAASIALVFQCHKDACDDAHIALFHKQLIALFHKQLIAIRVGCETPTFDPPNKEEKEKEDAQEEARVDAALLAKRRTFFALYTATEFLTAFSPLGLVAATVHSVSDSPLVSAAIVAVAACGALAAFIPHLVAMSD